MEKITKIDGVFYYGAKRCYDADDVYRRFRDEYNAGFGRAAYRWLSRFGSRKERIHEFGFIFDGEAQVQMDIKPVTVTLLGLVAGSYCWMLDGGVVAGTTDEEIQRWIDAVFEKGSRLLHKTGRKKGFGRNSKRLRTRYR
jgi:hypothetical protein